MGAVIEAQEGEGVRAGFVAGVGQGGDGAHGARHVFRALLHVFSDGREVIAGVVRQLVALFRNGEAGYLERRRFEDFLEALPVFGEIGTADDGFDNGADDFVFKAAVGVHGDGQAQIVEGAVYVLDDFFVVRFSRNDARLSQAFVEQMLLEGGDEGAENIAAAEVNPLGSFLRRCFNSLCIELIQGDTGLFPGSLVFDEAAAM